jgi:hypothetical protein
MRRTNKLTPLAIKHAKTPGLYGDGGGLYLQVSTFGTKSWVLRFMRGGVARKMGLGAIDIVPLSDARERAREARRKLLDGIDPIEARREQRTAQKHERAKVIIFRECARQYLTRQEGAWKNAKHKNQWRSTLETYAYPVFGDLPVASVDTALVLKALVKAIISQSPEARPIDHPAAFFAT